MKNVLTLFFILSPFGLMAQGYITIVVDAKLAATIIANHVVTMTALKPMVDATEEIKEYQQEIAAKTLVMREIKDLLYESMHEVSSVIKDGKNVKTASELVAEIGKYQADIVAYANDNPGLLSIAYSTEAALVTRSAGLLKYIFDCAIVGGDDNLMNSKQRMELIRYVLKELRIIRAIAFNMSMKMKVASRADVLEHPTPYGISYPDKDGSIVEDLLKK